MSSENLIPAPNHPLVVTNGVATDQVNITIDQTRRNRIGLKSIKMKRMKVEREARKRYLAYNEELCDAVNKGDTEQCSKLLESIDDVKVFAHAYLFAASRGHKNILELFLLKRADYISVRNAEGHTALNLSAKQKSVECCLFLIDQGIDITIADENNNYPIHVAAEEGLYKVVKHLLARGEDPSVTNHNDETPVHLAAMKGYDKVLKLLLKNGKRNPINLNAETKKEKFTPLILAAKYGHSWCCDVLKGCNINKTDIEGNTGLHYAAEKGFLKTIESLLKMKDPAPEVSIPNLEKAKPLHIVSKSNRLKSNDCFKLLYTYSGEIDPGPNKAGQTIPAIAASSLGNVNTLRYILNQEKFVKQINKKDFNGKTPLHLAIEAGNEDACQLILEIKTTRYDISDANFNFPLHLAASQGMTRICTELLRSKRGVGEMNSSNKDKNTALHLAAMNGFTECCNVFLYKRADAHLENKNLFTALHLAAIAGHSSILEIFWNRGYITELRETVKLCGDSPLQLAVRNDRIDCVAFLLKTLSNNFSDFYNSDGISILDEVFNRENRNQEMFKLILSYWPAWTTDEQKACIVFKNHLHQFMHKAIDDHQRIIQDSIVESSWWYSAISNEYCSSGNTLCMCHNLRNLVDDNPEAAKNVFKRCITRKNHEVIYDFRIFEDSFYTVSPKTSMKNCESAFDDDGLLLKNYKTFHDDTPHLLKIAIKHGDLDLLNHPLTEAFWLKNWKNYLCIILLLQLTFEIFITVFIGLFSTYVWNWEQLYDKYNISNETAQATFIAESCDTDFITELAEDGENESFVLYIRVTLIFAAVLMVVMKYFSYRAYPHFDMDNYLSLGTHNLRLLGIIFISLPSSNCSQNFILITGTYQWIVSVIIMLLSWFIMMRVLNEFPIFAVFMPLTTKYITSTIKVLFFILLILFVYTFIFFFLFRTTHTSFDNIWRSFMKSTVWFLGDLGYDDMFIENKVLYPVVSNLIFLSFITSITGFCINLIITQPQDELDIFREKTKLYKLSCNVETMLKYNYIFSYLYKKNVVSKLTVKNKSKTERKFWHFIHSWDIDYVEEVKEFTNQDIRKELDDLKNINLKLTEELNQMKVIVINSNSLMTKFVDNLNQSDK